MREGHARGVCATMRGWGMRGRMLFFGMRGGHARLHADSGSDGAGSDGAGLRAPGCGLGAASSLPPSRAASGSPPPTTLAWLKVLTALSFVKPSFAS